MENSVIFKIYVYDINNKLVEDREYTFNFNEKIMDIKNKILKTTFNDKYNHLDMENITEKVYKDYGKLYFNIGLLPSTIDNYKLSEFTTFSRTFSFIVIGSNINKKVEKPKESSGILQKIFMNEKIKSNKSNKSSDFVMYKDDFPPL